MNIKAALLKAWELIKSAPSVFGIGLVIGWSVCKTGIF